MNKELQLIIKPELYNSLLVLAKDDVILTQVLQHSDSTPNFINALVAGILCLVDREKSFQDMLVQLLKTNPECQKIMELKNDSSLLHEEAEEEHRNTPQ